MADSSFSIDGLEQLRAAAAQLPTAMTARLKAIAEASAQRIADDARARLLAQADAPETVAAIKVVPDEANKQFRVESSSPSNRPANLVLWFEYGTVHQNPRPYLDPALKAETPNYLSQLEAAATEVLTDLFG